MAEYFITKRERCECYYGLRREFLPSDFDESSQKTLVPLNLSPSQTVNDAQCKVFGCFNGYIESSVDLLEVLAKVRWSHLEMGGSTARFQNLTIED
jgi:hypothetical protein